MGATTKTKYPPELVVVEDPEPSPCFMADRNIEELAAGYDGIEDGTVVAIYKLAGYRRVARLLELEEL